MAKNLLVMLFFMLVPLSAGAETVYITADRDNTLVEDPAGALSNGSGPYFFVGRSGAGVGTPFTIRRGLLHFDIASGIPQDAIIESASLTLHLSRMSIGGPDKVDVGLYRLLTGWGEGESASATGPSAPAQPGDATWIHTFYDEEFWVHEGGHFVHRAIAQQEIGIVDPVDPFKNFYTWEATNHLVQDVRLWLHDPEQNFGWLIIGDETTDNTARRFDSREHSNPHFRPLLTVIYRLPGEELDDHHSGED